MFRSLRVVRNCTKVPVNRSVLNRADLKHRLFSGAPTIQYTKTDEAPALATYSLLPIIKGFTASSGIQIESPDISVAARIIAAFNDSLPEDKRVPDTMAALGELVKTADANVIKLPNISASVPQLKEAVKELQLKGYDLPDYPEEAKTEAELIIQNKYKTVMGSAVNPVLREGNSDRRAPPAVKMFAKANPHRMGKWSKDCKSHVSHMTSGDFRSNEKSYTAPKAETVRIEHVAPDGTVTVLVEELPLLAGEVLDATFMSKKALVSFLKAQIADAKAQGVLFSLHMKATMMKVSDPILFGHCVKVFFEGVFEKHGEALESLGVNVNNGFGDLLAKIESLPADQKADIEADIKDAYANGPDIAMVDSDKGITNLHVPSDVIVDASMPAMLRTSGAMWNAKGELQDTKCVLPDSSYAGIYQAVFDHCIEHGAFDPTTMGSCPNVGLMAQKAEEYGSHNKTFEVPSDGIMRVVHEDGKTTLFEHQCEEGDVWRACQVKDAPIRDWVSLAVRRARATNVPTVFWLDQERAHDAQMLKKVHAYLKDEDTTGLEIKVLAPEAACRFTLDLLRAGKDCISVTGNVLRDYNTDLFPILELGTSAKMLSIVPLMNGGGMFETGAGGSAPKHVQQMEKESHLRWDSLGEFLALAVSFEHIAERFDNKKAKVLGETLNDATIEFLLSNKSPSRKVNELDNRGSHYFLAQYWADALALNKNDKELAEEFAPIAESLKGQEETILQELLDAQGSPADLGGYYYPITEKCEKEMRPSPTFNGIIDSINK